MKKIKFIGDGDGVVDNGVHFIGALGGDYTLCGLSLDGDSMTTGNFIETDEPITCIDCLSIVLFCKRIRKKELFDDKNS